MSRPKGTPVTQPGGTPLRGQDLSDRELQVLRLVADGASVAEAAAAMHLSESTVKTHHNRMLVKLGATNRAHAVHIAHQRRILGGER